MERAQYPVHKRFEEEVPHVRELTRFHLNLKRDRRDGTRRKMEHAQHLVHKRFEEEVPHVP